MTVVILKHVRQIAPMPACTSGVFLSSFALIRRLAEQRIAIDPRDFNYKFLMTVNEPALIDRYTGIKSFRSALMPDASRGIQFDFTNRLRVNNCIRDLDARQNRRDNVRRKGNALKFNSQLFRAFDRDQRDARNFNDSEGALSVRDSYRKFV